MLATGDDAVVSLAILQLGDNGESSWWDLEMPKPSHALHQVLHAQKLLGEHLLHSLINIMQEHVRHTRSFPVPCHHCCREYRRHPPRCLWEPSTRHIDHYQIPLSVVILVGKPCQGKPALVISAQVFNG
ncbi:hypothetical protein V6N13_013983 [Hibiscus sabdariffa]